MGTAETRAKNKYNAKAYDQIPLRVRLGKRRKYRHTPKRRD